METQISEKANNEWVAIREETQEWVQKFSQVLSEGKIESQIVMAPGCNASSCGCKFHLLVSENDVQAAHECIHEHELMLYPEMKESHEWAAQEKCPACGHDISGEVEECGDCGLRFLVEEN